MTTMTMTTTKTTPMAMLDWLRRGAENPSVLVAGKPLPLAIRRNPRARRLTLRLAPDGSEARLSMPRWGRTADALAFAHTQAAWLACQLAALPGRRALCDGAIVPYRGTPHVVRHDAALPRHVIFGAGTITLGGPAEELERRVTRWLKAQARELLRADLADYCRSAGPALPALALSNARSRWGSCSSKGMIRISWRLVMAPDTVRRSVVAHEVAHLLHFDHSPGFHAALRALYEGDLDDANAWLKAHGRSLHAVL